MIHYDALERFAFDAHKQRQAQAAQVRLLRSLRQNVTPPRSRLSRRIAAWLGKRIAQSGLGRQRRAAVPRLRDRHAHH